MHLLMADVAVLKTRATQIVECRRRGAQRSVGGCRWPWEVRMALQAHESHFVARQHPRIGGAVRLVARRAAFQPHRSVLEGERTSLVTMTLETAGLVGIRRLEGSR